MWETRGLGGSPVSNDGRGLKPDEINCTKLAKAGSPVSNDGRGLKLAGAADLVIAPWVRPLAMTGVD